MMSGRKLGSEAYTILSHDSPNRKSSNASTINPDIASKDSFDGSITLKSSINGVSSRYSLKLAHLSSVYLPYKN